jgi:branched-chain amino acid transport system permease protein
VSDARVLVESKVPVPPAPERRRAPRSRSSLVPGGLVLLAVLVTAAVPLYIGGFFLQAGLFVMASAVGAVGLNLLTGTTGQLSLGHAFFIAVGAYSYGILAGEPAEPGSGDHGGLGLPTAPAAVLAVLVAGAAGAAFSPIAGRLRGIYLAVASLGLVFLGTHLLTNGEAFTGGFEGLGIPPLAIGPLAFENPEEDLFVLGVPFGREELLWYLFLVLVVGAVLFARNIVRGRQGRAMVMVRDSEIAAAVVGVNVQATKAKAFVLSSMYAGLAGVMIGLAYGRIVPENFGLVLSIEYLAMIIIGGLGSVAGAVIGAVFVTGLTQFLPYLSSSLPFLVQPGQEGITAAVLARMVYGALIVICVLYLPSGIASLPRMLARRLGQRRGAAGP